MIEVIKVTKKYSDLVAVNDISFKVEPGKIYGLLGPNGAGKTTIINIMTGCLASTSGTVRINGYDIYEEPLKAKKFLGYLPELPPLYLDMTPSEYLRFVADAKDVNKTEISEHINKIIKLIQIAEVKDRLIKNLSKGYRQRIGLAQSIIGYPEIIVLDEPMVGLDPRQIIEMREIIRELGRDHTIVLSSHILSEISLVCDHILVISKGDLLVSDTTDNLRKEYFNGNSINLSVKGTAEKIRNSLKRINGITKIKTSKSNENDVVKVVVDTRVDVDLRENISKSLIESDCLILSMSQSETSLEDIFLSLTGERKKQKNNN